MVRTDSNPVVVAPSPTPVRDDDSIDFAAIEHNVNRWLETPLSGFVLNTENGEEAFFSEQDRLEVVRTVRRVSGNQKLIIGGVDSPSVSETIRMSEALVGAGAELIRMRIPRLTTNICGYFEQVIPRVPAPVIVIHQMAPGLFLSSPTSIAAEPELLSDLVAYDNVFGYIGSDNLRFESRLRTLMPAEKQYWASNGSLLVPGVMMGANGACMMLGNVAPHACCDILCHGLAGDWAEAQRIQTRVLELDWQILSRRAAGLKAALNLLGYQAGLPRSPTLPCTANDLEIIRQALLSAGLLLPQDDLSNDGGR